MHGWLTRLQTVFFFSLSVLLLLTLAIAGISYLQPMPNGQVKAIVSKPTVVQFGELGRGQYFHRPSEAAKLAFNLDLDLTPLWHNWNTKQVFVWIAATHTTSKRQHNEIILWDRIIQSPQQAKFRKKQAKAEYAVVDLTKELKTNVLHLTVRWEVMPLVGALKQGGGYEWFNTSVVLPEKYIR